MRFYKRHQAEMLNRVAYLLKQEQDALSAKVPAFKDIIPEFVEKEAILYKLVSSNPRLVVKSVIEKKTVKDGLIEALKRLLSAIKAYKSRNRSKQFEAINYTSSGLKKLKAKKLAEESLKIINAAKKIKNPLYYGLSADYLSDAQAYRKEFINIKTAPTLRLKERAQRNKQANDGIKECITMLEDIIDPLVELATEGNRELRDKYKATRKVLPRGPGRLSFEEDRYRKSRERKKEG